MFTGSGSFLDNSCRSIELLHNIQHSFSSNTCQLLQLLKILMIVRVIQHIRTRLLITGTVMVNGFCVSASKAHREELDFMLFILEVKTIFLLHSSICACKLQAAFAINEIFSRLSVVFVNENPFFNPISNCSHLLCLQYIWVAAVWHSFHHVVWKYVHSVNAHRRRSYLYHCWCASCHICKILTGFNIMYVHREGLPLRLFLIIHRSASQPLSKSWDYGFGELLWAILL